MDRAISVLKLFTLERPGWTVDALATELAVSTSSAYRYVAVLMEAGLLAGASAGQYRLGPAMIQYDRQIQLTDPLLQAARPVMAALRAEAPPGSVALLCRIFRDTVLCIHQDSAPGMGSGVSYERGRPMPLFRGATSKIILAYLPPRDLRRLYAEQATAIADAGLGASWPEFRTHLSGLRRAGHAATSAELDPGRVGIAAPLFDDARRILGSLSIVVPASAPDTIALLAPLVTGAAAETIQNSHILRN